MKVPEPRQLKSGRWFIQLRLGGESVPVTASDRTACIHAAEVIKSQHRAGLRRRRAEDSELTMRKAIDRYIKHREKKLSPATVRGYRIIQRCRFQEYMDTPLRDIKSWQLVYDSESARLNAKTLKNSFALLQTAYKYATGKSMPEVDKVEPEPNEHPFLNAEEILRFLDAAKGDDAEIGALLALSSLRCSEIMDLDWSRSIDLEKQIIYVRGASVHDENGKLVHKNSTKNRTSKRPVPIFIPQLLDALKDVEQTEGKVVKYTPNGLYKAVNRICSTAGVPQVGIHGLRHSFASLCAVHLQVPEEIAMELGGWSDYKTMHKIYTHVSAYDMHNRVSQLRDFYRNANEKC